ncbi:hypothetical protein ACFQ07_08190, partial [Actinomadura adrarensis]
MTIHLRPGDRVRATLDCSVENVIPLRDGQTLLELAYDHDGSTMNCALPLSVIDVERLTPTVMPKPGEIWKTDDGALWFAQRRHADYDDDEDFAGCNEFGWRVVMVPLDGGPY